MAIEFPIESTGKKFSFTAVCKDLEQVLSRVTNALGASNSQTKYFFIVARNKKLAVVAYSQDTFCAVQVPNAVSEAVGAFGVDPATFSGVIKGRSEMDFKFDGKELSFQLTKGKYSGNLTTLVIQDEQAAHVAACFAPSKKANGNVLSRDLLKTLKEGMMMTAIKDVYTSQDLASHIVFGDKSVTVSAFDHHHFAMYKTKLKDSAFNDFRIVLPVNHFNIIDRMVDSSDKDSKFILRPESVRVEGSNFLLVLPATQSEEQNFTRVQEFIKAQGDMPFKFAYKPEQLSTLVDNLYTLKAANANFEIKYTGKNLTFTFTTPNGSATDALKIKTVNAKADKAKVSVDPILLKDLMSLSKSQKNVAIGFKPKKILSIECKTDSNATLILASALVP